MGRRGSAAHQAKLGKIVRSHRELAERVHAQRLARDVANLFSSAAAKVEHNLRGFLKEAPGYPDSDSIIDWDDEEAKLAKVVHKNAVQLSEDVFGSSSQILGVTIDFNLGGRPIQQVLEQIGKRITNVTDFERDRVRYVVEEGVAAGKSPGEVARDLINIFSTWAGKEGGVAHSRAMVIARTETAFAYNGAALASYQESGIVDSLICLDSAECGWSYHDDPDLADNTVRTYTEAADFPLSHPNCVRAFAPNIQLVEHDATLGIFGENLADFSSSERPATVLEPQTPTPVDQSLFANPKEFEYLPYSGAQTDPADIYGAAINSVLGEVSPEEKFALTSYGGAGYHNINEILRFGTSAEAGRSKFAENQIEHINELMARAGLPEAVRAFRGTSARAAFGQAMDDELQHGGFTDAFIAKVNAFQGRTFEDKAYFSTALVKESAFGHKGVEIVLTVPKGYKGVYLNGYMRGDEAAGLYAFEKELLLDRGVKLLYERIELIRSNYGPTGIRVFAKVVPK